LPVSLEEAEVFDYLNATLPVAPPALPPAVCWGCMKLLGVDGAAVALLGDGRRETLCVSDDVVSEVEEWQFTYDEGPCVSAFTSGESVWSGLTDGNNPWPRFAGKARAAGFLELAGLPLLSGSRPWGVLELYRTEEGLDEATIADAGAVARAIARLLLTRLPTSPTGADLVTTRDEVHQASGVVSVQRGIPIDEALGVLREFAIEHDRLLRDVANDVVAGGLRFDA
jgi:hypothetical protein